MKLRRLLPLLILLALLVAPFGRIAAAKAMAIADQPAMAMAGHCEERPAPEQDRSDRTHQAGIDCLAACAAMAMAESAPLAVVPAVAPPHVGLAPPLFAGLHPEADPPPPRLS